MTCITTLHCKYWLTLCRQLERQLRGTGSYWLSTGPTMFVYLRQNGREKCDEKGEPSCHAFRFSWAAASPTIIFPERAYSSVKGCNENKCRRVKRYIPLRVHMHVTSVCRSTSNFQLSKRWRWNWQISIQSYSSSAQDIHGACLVFHSEHTDVFSVNGNVLFWF